MEPLFLNIPKKSIGYIASPETTPSYKTFCKKPDNIIIADS